MTAHASTPSTECNYTNGMGNIRRDKGLLKTLPLPPCRWTTGRAAILVLTAVLQRLFAWDKYLPATQGLLLQVGKLYWKWWIQRLPRFTRLPSSLPPAPFQAHAQHLKIVYMPALVVALDVLPLTTLYPSAHAQEKHQRLHQQRLQALYTSFGIKRILHPQRHLVEWHGCSRVCWMAKGRKLGNTKQRFLTS